MNLTFWYFKLWLPLKNRSWSPGPEFETIRHIKFCILLILGPITFPVFHTSQLFTTFDMQAGPIIVNDPYCTPNYPLLSLIIHTRVPVIVTIIYLTVQSMQALFFELENVQIGARCMYTRKIYANA